MASLPSTEQNERDGADPQPDTLATPSLEADLIDLTQGLISSRQNVPPKRLLDPGPTAMQINQMLCAAAAAPDHGMLIPWRFVIVPPDKRALLGEAFALALTDRDCNATPEQVAAAHEKAHRAPFLMLAIARLGPDESGIAALDRLVSLGCALQNILLTAHAMGFGAGVTSGQAMASPRMRDLFKLVEGEQAVCCVNVGTVAKRKPLRRRPAVAEFSSTL